MMNWLTRWMMREGPGIPKGLPKPTGLRLFGHILLREAWELFKLNLLIVVFSLPLVTAPAEGNQEKSIPVRFRVTDIGLGEAASTTDNFVAP